MNQQDQLKVQACLDEELSPTQAGEVRELLARDSEALALYEALSSTRSVLKSNEQPRSVPDSRAFYWSSIEREIARQAAAQPVSASGWFRSWWRFALPALGTAALVALLLVVVRPEPEAGKTSANFHEIETPMRESSAITFHSESAGMTVIWIASHR
jgi:anti-sigma factor RsiW